MKAKKQKEQNRAEQNWKKRQNEVNISCCSYMFGDVVITKGIVAVN
jgi:hypothetical protein